MASLLDIVVFIALSLTIVTAKCNHACTDDYTPVCAKNRNGDLQTFSNDCELTIAQCENPSAGWFRLKDGACLTKIANICIHNCNQNYEPICARNKNGELKTFPNSCELTAAQCENPSIGWFRFRDGACLTKLSLRCNHICNQIYEPICARNKNGELKTFPNSCELTAAQCENPSIGWFRFRDGACLTKVSLRCNHICNQIYEPICARNKNRELKTFPNSCELTAAQCENPSIGWFRFRDGACLTKVSLRCNHICNQIYEPICARNKNGELKTFPNSCELTAAQCENPSIGWFRFRDGACLTKVTIRCNQNCIQNYEPICARNKNGELKTFPNSCELTAAQCENPSIGWFRFRDGACLTKVSLRCNHICNQIYEPICARNKNGELKTFPNSCELTAAQCENPSIGWFRFRDGACLTKVSLRCNHICNQIYEPICARNKNGELKTFPNSCELSAAQCENPSVGWFRFRDGACLIKVAIRCNQNCIQIYEPICARNKNGELKTFPNSCELTAAQCENPSIGWFRFRDGACLTKVTIRCNQNCIQNYEPICARNKNGELKTFPNSCELTAAQCENPSIGWFRFRDGACLTKVSLRCNHICNQIYEPICARNKNGELKTFPNSCELTAAQCENPSIGWFRFRDGACLTKVSLRCNHICNQIYEPICARNKNGELKTFPNSCELSAAQCENPSVGWFRFRDGACLIKVAIRCNQNCIQNYEPICARNKNGELKTFPNSCELSAAKCENTSVGWFISRDGACE